MTQSWNPPPLPYAILGFSRRDVANQPVPWVRAAWAQVFAGHEPLLDKLDAHSRAHGGRIHRAVVHDLADGEPVELFLAAMAWGWGNVGYGPKRVQRILAVNDINRRLAAIVGAVRDGGAGDGWTALLRDHKIPGLGMAFGTKLLYFAGYRLEHRPRPLILDARVRATLQQAAPGAVPPAGRTVWRADYERYLDLAETWAADPTWRQEPDVVEYWLFNDRPDPDAEITDSDASGQS